MLIKVILVVRAELKSFSLSVVVLSAFATNRVLDARPFMGNKLAKEGTKIDFQELIEAFTREGLEEDG